MTNMLPPEANNNLLPAGYTMHPPAEEDIRRAYEVIEEGFQDHFAHTPRSFEEWEGELVRESFDPSLWFLALNGDRAIGAALCRLRDPEAGHGLIAQLAVLPPWRKRSIAGALLHHSFYTFAQRDCKRVGLYQLKSNSFKS